MGEDMEQFVAWDGKTYNGKPPAGWHQGPDGRWWSPGSGGQEKAPWPPKQRGLRRASGAAETPPSPGSFPDPSAQPSSQAHPSPPPGRQLPQAQPQGHTHAHRPQHAPPPPGGRAPGVASALPGPPVWIAAGGLALVVVGSFLAWATIPGPFVSFSISGADLDGALTAFLGLAGLAALGVAHFGPRPAVVAAAGAGVLVVVVGIFNVSKFDGNSPEFGFAEFDVGIGLWLVLLGGLVAAVAAAVESFGLRAQSQPMSGPGPGPGSPPSP